MKQPSPTSPNKLIAKLRQDLADLTVEARAAELTLQGRRKLNKEIEQAAVDLSALLTELDPIRRPAEVFDPGNPRTIGFFIALALTAQPRESLATLPPHYGSGIYALYYKGDFPLYEPISGTETPIYVGQAVSGNDNARTPVEQGIRLAARLGEHRKTISRASASLRLEDFECRALVVQTGWETPAEDYLIRLFRPIWNKETKIIQGFGKHGDAPTTRQNKVSSWDVLHQGREEAGYGLNPLQKTEEILTEELREHFSKTNIYKFIDDILTGFIDALKQS